MRFSINLVGLPAIRIDTTKYNYYFFFGFNIHLNCHKQFPLEQMCFCDNLVGFNFYLNGCYMRNLPLWIVLCSLFNCRNQLTLNFTSKWLQKSFPALDTTAKGHWLVMAIAAIVMDANAIFNSLISLFVLVTLSQVCWSTYNFLVCWSI